MSRTIVETSTPYGTRYEVTDTRVDEPTALTCEYCRQQLWSRDGRGSYVLAMMYDGAPVLSPHFCCP